MRLAIVLALCFSVVSVAGVAWCLKRQGDLVRYIRQRDGREREVRDIHAVEWADLEGRVLDLERSYGVSR